METQPPSVIAQKELQNNSQYKQAQRILKSSSAYDMSNILRDVIQHGTGRAALRIGRNDLGGKTGTTNDAKDAWFAGFNGKLVSVAWVGFDRPTTLGRREYGGVAALPIWTNFMAKALQGTPESWVSLDQKAKDPHRSTSADTNDEPLVLEQLVDTFDLIKEYVIDANLSLNQDDLKHLIAMTPYAYKAKPERRLALEERAKFDVAAQYQIYLFQKK